MARRGKGVRSFAGAAGAALRKKLLGLIRKGIYPSAAAAMCGITRQTLFNEKQRDPTLAEEVDQAIEASRGALEERLFAASKGKEGDWKAAKEYLSRRWPDDWAQRRPDAIEVRKLLPRFTELVTGTIERLPADEREAYKTWFQNWIDRLLADAPSD